jgi:VWFA-related protein
MRHRGCNTASFAALVVFSLAAFFPTVTICRSQTSAPTSPQTTPDTRTPSPAPPVAEMSTEESAPMFKVNVKEVLVRVTARDNKGNAIGNLTKDDFLIYDKGKPQVITHFSVEKPGAQAAKAQESSQGQNDPIAPEKSPDVPERFIAYMFDDIHLQFGDLARVRDAAERHFATLRHTDRAAIFTTSGLTVLEYTDDRAKLHASLAKLKPQPVAGAGARDCPDISYYMADLIVNKRDQLATQLAASDALSCNGSYSGSVTNANPTGVVTGGQSAAIAQASAQAQMALSRGDTETRISLNTLKEVVRNISVMPGQRSIVLISPGFIIPNYEYELNDIIDRALRADVPINSLDARGLFALVPGGDASYKGPSDSVSASYRSTYDSQEAFEDADLMESLADSTGGNFFHNNNDLDEGFRRVGATPEYFYLIGFSPQNLKPDGSFHKLKVTIKPPTKLNLQARRGYYAPKHLPNPAEEAKQEIQDAIFSQEEMHDVPLELHTQFFKPTDDAAKLTVLAHLDVRQLHFHKEEGRNGEELTIVSVLFDRNGAFIQGNQKTVTFHLKDETLSGKLNNGITMKTSFDAKPGSYLVRVVVRDADGQMSAENGAVEIP